MFTYPNLRNIVSFTSLPRLFLQFSKLLVLSAATSLFKFCTYSFCFLYFCSFFTSYKKDEDYACLYNFDIACILKYGYIFHIIIILYYYL